jgi:hypothetical protein
MNRPAGRRVAFLSEHASPCALLGGEDAGGQNVYVDEVSRRLVSLGFEVDVFVRRDAPELDEIVDWADGVRVVHLDAGPARFLLKDDLWQHMPAFRNAFLRFAARQGQPYDLVHGNFWMSGWVAGTLRQRYGTPAVQIFHALGTTKQQHQGPADTSPRERIAVERSVVRQVDRLIAQCPDERDELIDGYQARPEKITIIPAGVNLERFRPVERGEARARLGIPAEDFVAVYVGRMLPRKDVRNIVRAMALLSWGTEKPLRLLIVGGDRSEPDPDSTPEIGVLQALGRELGVSHLLNFTGKRGPDELRYYYAAGDVAVTTPWYEPFGLTPIEAMACGRPVIGSAVGGITFTIQDGATGFLVPPADPEALARQLRFVLDHPEQTNLMGAWARSRAERHFSWATTAAQTAALYERVLAGPGLASDTTRSLDSHTPSIRLHARVGAKS